MFQNHSWGVGGGLVVGWLFLEGVGCVGGFCVRFFIVRTRMVVLSSLYSVCCMVFIVLSYVEGDKGSCG